MYRVHRRRTTCEYSDQCWRISARPTRCTLHTRNNNADWGPTYEIAYGLSYDYLKFIVRYTYMYDSDSEHDKISVKNIVS